MSSQPKAPFEPHLQAPLLAALLASLAIGCASPGPPRPPSLKLPEPVTDLSAQRIGDQVLLQWTTPSKSTDNLAIKETLSARICRAAVTSSTAAPAKTPPPPATTPDTSRRANPNIPPVNPCTTVFSVSVKPGPSSATETLPADLTSDPVALLDYRVEINNSSHHSAGLSNPALAAAGAAPPPVAALRATPAATGVILQWTPTNPPTPTNVELHRVDQTLAAARQLHSDTASNPAQPIQLASKESTEVRLSARPAASDPNSPEPAGTIDTTARFGEIYRYSAQRIRAVTLYGHTLVLRSIPSEPITLALHDTFPPATPTGLYAVLGQLAPAGNVSAATSTPALAIDLSWQPNTEPDLAGYIVYRRQLPSGLITRLTAAPIPGPAFRDTTATPGQLYAYFITAIDTSGNESKPSPEVQQTIPLPTTTP